MLAVMLAKKDKIRNEHVRGLVKVESVTKKITENGERGMDLLIEEMKGTY